ncbi:MAG: hypothetical protein FWE70_01580, partial [Oscillospiraceae bacterium]|nr:hypothetical protein [Oscillospiraceae bacterium]
MWTLLSDIPVGIDKGRILSALRIPDDEGDDSYAALAGVMEAALGLARPKAIYRVVDDIRLADEGAVIGGIAFRSKVMAVNLKGAGKVIPYAITCGKELDAWSSRIKDPYETFLADNVKEHILYGAIAHTMRTVEDAEGVANVRTLNPGSTVDWHLSEQARLFELI